MSKTYRKRTLQIVIVVIIVAVLSFLIWILPEFLLPSANQISPADEKLIGIQNQYRQIIAQIIGGAVVLYGIYSTLVRIEEVEKNLEIAQEGQITDRFTKAIEQLGHENSEIKIGSIYALERISIDSPRDYWSVIEVLSAFIRRTSNLDTISKEDKINKDIPPQRSIEIQTALNVLTRRNRDELEAEEDRHLNLSLSNLRNAYLGKSNLSRANFWQSDLSYAYLGKANLQNAYMGKATLQMADLNNVNLDNVNFKEADLRNAKI